MKDTKPGLGPLSTFDLGAEATKPLQKVLRLLQKGLSLPVCKHQRTEKLWNNQGHVGLFLGFSTSHSGLNSALKESNILPH